MVPNLEEQFRSALGRLLRELFEGPPTDAAFFLNRGDRGLLAALDQLSAKDASARRRGGTSVAAHVDHLVYGLTLLNRWARGENPWPEANYAASWKRTRVTEEEWARLRFDLAEQAQAWRRAINERREWDEGSITEATASVVHLAYHLGAIRQIQSAAAGPPAKD